MTFEGFKPLNGRVLLEVLDEIEKMKGGLYIPDASKEKSNVGIVREVSSGCGVEVGSKVMFSQFAGSLVKLSGKEYLLILEKDLLGVFGNEAE